MRAGKTAPEYRSPAHGPTSHSSFCLSLRSCSSNQSANLCTQRVIKSSMLIPLTPLLFMNGAIPRLVLMWIMGKAPLLLNRRLERARQRKKRLPVISRALEYRHALNHQTAIHSKSRSIRATIKMNAHPSAKVTPTSVSVIQQDRCP